MEPAFANATKSVNAVATNARNAVFEAINNTAKTIVKNANAAAKNVGAVVPNVGSSLVKLGNSAVNAANSAINAATGQNLSVQPIKSSWATPLTIFVGFVAFFLLLFSLFGPQIRTGYYNLVAAVRKALGYPAPPQPANQIDSGAPVVPIPPLPDTGDSSFTPPETISDKLVETVLPSSGSGKEVFNVSENEYTYYDAEPLCRALGAELATYDQVKEAWERGADWCNYGWIKGQVAVYPTQEGTYKKLQAGPEEEQRACGVPGLNGGYFDNPEMRFGVNCYGNKPTQSAHDQRELISSGKIPPTPELLKTDQRAKEFAKEVDGMPINPFNGGKWSES